MVKENDGILNKQSLLTVREYSHVFYLHTECSKHNLFGIYIYIFYFVQYYKRLQKKLVTRT